MSYVIVALLCLLIGYLVGRYVIGPMLYGRQVLITLLWVGIMVCLPWIASRVQMLVALIVTLTFWVGWLLGWLTRGTRSQMVLLCFLVSFVVTYLAVGYAVIWALDRWLQIVSPPKPLLV